MYLPLKILAALCNKKVKIGMKFYPPPKGLDNPDNPGHKLHIGGCLRVPQKRLDGSPAKGSEKNAVVRK